MITDEMVEAAARAILAAELWPGSWEKANETERGHVLYKARAALTAVLPMIRDEVLEEAAKVAERRHKEWRMPHKDDAKPGEVCCDVTACQDIAAAIRAMKGTSHE